MILLPIDPKSNTPLYRQIIQGIIDLIENHTLEAGDQLPSTRQLSARLGINRTTIYWAYQELLALVYLDSRPGSYTTVRKRAPIVTAKQTVERSRIPWNKISNPSSQLVIKNYVNKYLEPEIFTSPDAINLSRLYIEEQLFPIQDFQRCLNNVLVNDGAKLFGYGEAAGYKPLRECVAHRLQSHGITVSGHEILITHGAQQAFELILKLLTNPGAGVVIEMPTYANIIPLLQYYQASIIEIPMLEYGMDLDHLKNVLEQKHPAFIYTMPNFHNPTGVTTSQAHRERLLSLSEKYRVPIVEDGFEEELKYFGKIILPIKSMDRRQTVLYVGTFSKVLFPGLRIGWIAADRECIKRLTALKHFSGLSGNAAIQAAMAHFYRERYYDRHVKRVHRVYRRKMMLALNTMKEYFPSDVIWTKPDGGYTIWLKLPKSYDKKILKNILLKHKVLVSPGNSYFYSSSPKRYFRISIANLKDEEVKKGIIRLSKVLDELNG